MHDKLNTLSYTLATVAGMCFVGGIVIISGGRVKQRGEIGDNHIYARRIVRH